MYIIEIISYFEIDKELMIILSCIYKTIQAFS